MEGEERGVAGYKKRLQRQAKKGQKKAPGRKEKLHPRRKIGVLTCLPCSFFPDFYAYVSVEQFPEMNGVRQRL